MSHCSTVLYLISSLVTTFVAYPKPSITPHSVYFFRNSYVIDNRSQNCTSYRNAMFDL